jgi:hypothetical protein
MNTRTIMKELQHQIKAMTADLDTEDYVMFMQELSIWADNEADMAEYLAEEIEEYE